jgi:nucleotide-binding universal stress UspA family protein
MRKLLIAVDGSECALKAADYVGKTFSGINDLQITLLHVLPYPPAPLWDEGHIPSDEEKREREEKIQNWLLSQHAETEEAFSRAADLMISQNISPLQIEKKSISDSIDVAESIIEETQSGGYQTLVIGKCGRSSLKKSLTGSVSAKILNQGTGAAICIVE